MTFIYVPPKSDFTIQNLPFGIFKPQLGCSARVGIAIGEQVLDLSVLAEAGLLGDEHKKMNSCFHKSSLNDFMSSGKNTWKKIRSIIRNLLSENESKLRDDEKLRRLAFHPMKAVIMEMPAVIGDYTDFYASEYHARNVGTIFRGKENALPINWKHIPIGYHGRSSSIVVSGTPIRRPSGQILPSNGSKTPQFQSSQVLDFELEVAALIGKGNELGESINVDEAMDHIFGLVLMNDWSARDIQKWEYVPLGPFLGKSFGTTISPWVVPIEALEPFICPAINQDPLPLPYLQEKQRFTLDISLEVKIKPNQSDHWTTVCRSNFKHLYWSLAQQVAHHTVNGCNLRTGDLLGSGTISGPDQNSMGSLLELTWGGSKSIRLGKECERTFLEDGDTVSITATSQADHFALGFGDCVGLVL